MAGEYRMGPFTAKAKVDSTVTEATWKERAKEGGWFVAIDGATCTADELGVDFLANNAAESVGRLITASGTGDKFRVTVAPCGTRGIAQGGATGAFAAGDYGKFMKANTTGKLIVDTSLTAGNIVVVGGDKAKPAVAWQWPH